MEISESLPRINLLKASDVAQMLNVSRSLVYRLLQEGQIPAIRINNTVRIKLQDLEIFIDLKSKEILKDGLNTLEVK
jgi:excisionase family DNA binding protein